MLLKAYRLKHRGLFNKALSSGKSVGRSPYVVLLVLPKRYEGPQGPKIGFIVSKKVSNKANRRNKVKRRLREIVRREVLPNHRDQLAPYSAVVLIAKFPAQEASFDALRQDVLRLVARLPMPMSKNE